MQEYANTDQQLHFLCQTIAKANRTFVPKREDDSHTNLYFDSIGNRIVGRWIHTPKGNLILSLNLSNLHFEWLDKSLEVIQSTSSVGHKISEIDQALEEGLKSLELDPTGFIDKLHFEIPIYNFTEKPISEINKSNMDEWTHYHQLANEACMMVLGHLQVQGEIRIWPHHFDTGIYIELKDTLGLGFGLAMKDSLANSPYFYISGYAKEGELEYINLPDLPHGYWETSSSWKGAMLPLADIAKLSSENQIKAIMDFSKKGIGWFAKNS